MSKPPFYSVGRGPSTLAWARELFEQFPACRQVYECAGDILGYDVAKLSFEGSEEDISAPSIPSP